MDNKRIQTFTGIKIDVFNPDPKKINIYDIAHSLSQMPRFAGHTAPFLSVAEHCLNCVKSVPPEYALEALLHDATEAYLCDLPKPIKNRLPGYVQLESKLMKIIASKFGLVFPFPQEIKRIDKKNLKEEYNKYMVYDTMEVGRSMLDVESEFVDTYFLLNELRNKIVT